jgi:hypothetical protein
VKFFKRAKDGGPESTVTGYWLTEIKSLFSIVLLRFDNGSRDQFHSHAFNSLNWVLKGTVSEEHLSGYTFDHGPSAVPVFTGRNTFHRVVSHGTTWVLSFRGPWNKTWMEYDPKTDCSVRLTHGRVQVDG